MGNVTSSRDGLVIGLRWDWHYRVFRKVDIIVVHLQQPLAGSQENGESLGSM